MAKSKISQGSCEEVDCRNVLEQKRAESEVSLFLDEGVSSILHTTAITVSFPAKLATEVWYAIRQVVFASGRHQSCHCCKGKTFLFLVGNTFRVPAL